MLFDVLLHPPSPLLVVNGILLVALLKPPQLLFQPKFLLLGVGIETNIVVIHTQNRESLLELLNILFVHNHSIL